MADDRKENQTSLPSLSEQLTANFYKWEVRGRGWKLWPDAVELEPVYEPFRHQYSGYPSSYDDGRRMTFLGALIERIRNSFSGNKQKECALPEEEITPPLFDDSSPLKYLTISLSLEDKVDFDNAEQFLLSLKYCTLPVSFEVIGKSELTTVQLVCRESDLHQLRPQFEAYFPDAVVYNEGEELKCLTNGNKSTVVVDFGLAQEFMRPIRAFKGFEPDPMTGIFGAMEDLEKDELGVFQVLFQPAHNPWADSIARSVTDWQGKSFFADCPDMPHLAKDKIQKPLFAACVRVATQSKESSRAWEIARALTGGLAPLARPDSNELVPLVNDGYDDLVHAEDVCLRQSRRSGMLLNSQELVSLVHPPSQSIRVNKLQRELKKTKLAPSITAGNKFVLGKNIHEGKETIVSLSSEQRLRHTHIIGATGTGKSTLLLKMIVQDIENGLGVGVLDPHGDLIDRILGYIPESRFEDVVLLDPSDSDYPVGLNILSAYSDIDKTVLSSDLVGVFKRLSTAWGDQMNSIFGNAILAFLESEKGGTLVDLRSFLVEKDFREKFLGTVKDQDVIYYWHKVFPQLGGRLYAPILTRLDTFLRPKPIRYMAAQKEGLNFQKILDGNKIFLAKLAHGLIGMENAYLLGTIICSKFHQAAMARQAVSDIERRDFFLYIDEFQNFVTESMTEILSGARKYHFGLILAHQELHQLLSKDSQLASSVISNPGTRICFRLGDFDAKKLEDGFSSFDARDLQNLGVGEAIARVERAEYDFNLKIVPPADVAPGLVKQKRERLISLSRQKYALPKEKVVEELAKQKRVTEEIVPVPQVSEPAMEEPGREITQGGIEEKPSRPTRVKTEIPAPVAEGKGGQQHKYYQHLIRQTAEAYGYRAMIEQATEDGSGSVDVHMERDGKKVACEISVTSTGEQELGNIQNRLAAGYDLVILCSPLEKTLGKVKKLIANNLSMQEQQKVLFLSPEETISYLKEQAAAGAAKEEWVRGRKVKVGFKPVTGEKENSKLKSIGEVLLSSLRRLKGRK
jgi:hypothetical protein